MKTKRKDPVMKRLPKEIPITELRFAGLTLDVDTNLEAVLKYEHGETHRYEEQYQFVAACGSGHAVYFSNDWKDFENWFDELSLANLYWLKGEGEWNDLSLEHTDTRPWLKHVLSANYSDGGRCSCEDYPCCGH